MIATFLLGLAIASATGAHPQHAEPVTPDYAETFEDGSALMGKGIGGEAYVLVTLPGTDGGAVAWYVGP
jgi:hypothetical protein